MREVAFIFGPPAPRRTICFGSQLGRPGIVEMPLRFDFEAIPTRCRTILPVQVLAFCWMVLACGTQLLVLCLIRRTIVPVQRLVSESFWNLATVEFKSLNDGVAC